MRVSRALFAGVLLLWAAAAEAAPAPAEELDRIASAVASLEEQATQLEQERQRESLGSARHVEERLTDAELFFNLQDYTRASILYLDVVENYPDHPGFPEALYQLAECLFRMNNHYGARTRFGEVLDQANRPGFEGYVQGALGRLIEIAIHVDEFEGVEGHFVRLAQLPPAVVTGATHYARGRFLFHGSRHQEAAQAFNQVPADSEEHPRAQYHMGVIAIVNSQYEPAIEIFRGLTQMEPETSDDRQVVDLAHIAMGALYLELDRPEEAIRSYQAVNRNSRYFGQALFQAAAAFRRLGDSTRAERALEVLTVAAPSSHYIPQAKILRGNLLLDTGRFTESREVFEDVTKQFRPVREQLQEVLSDERDPSAYFQELVRANMEVFDASSFIPSLAVRWVREEPGFRRAMEVLEITAECGRSLEETERLLLRLEAAVNGPSAINLFPNLRQGAVRAVQVNNRLARLRGRLTTTEAQIRGGGNSQLRSVTDERRRLEQELRDLPTDSEEYAEQEDSARAEYRSMGRRLAQVAARIDRLQAMVVAIELYLRDTSEQRDADPAAEEAMRNELAVHRQAIESHRQEIASIRTLIETGQIQVGIGDEQNRANDQLRQRYNQVVERERQILASSGGGGAQAQRAEQVYQRMQRVQNSLDQFNSSAQRQAEAQSQDIRVVLDQERTNLGRYALELQGLRSEAETVIGHAAYLNFQRVRDRFYDLVRQGDVGIIDVAWAEREEHRHRIDRLSDERRRQLQALADEFREVTEEQETEEN